MRSRRPYCHDDGVLSTLIVCTLLMLLIQHCEAIAHADTYVHLKSESTCTTVKGNTVTLPPGYFVDEAKLAALEAEHRRLQDAETRLTAENSKLREQASTWRPSWKTIIGAVVSISVVLAIDALRE